MLLLLLLFGVRVAIVGAVNKQVIKGAKRASLLLLYDPGRNGGDSSKVRDLLSANDELLVCDRNRWGLWCLGGRAVGYMGH